MSLEENELTELFSKTILCTHSITSSFALIYTKMET